MNILILGGYGVFGGRLAKLLADIPAVKLLISGRDAEKARAFCATFSGRATVVPLQLDRSDIVEALLEHRPDLLVDASGPFQDYGSDRYCVVQACISAKIDYMDFADAADFVSGVSQFDEAARRAGIFVLSGVSSFPVLTAAVLREMAKTMEVIEVAGGIAPSPHAGIGLNVMRAVVGYAGSPVKLLRGGIKTNGIGLAESMRFTVAVPGRVPLKNLRFSLVDVPDLQVLPPEHPTMTDIWMGAGPVPESLHRILNLLAKARARFGLASLEPFSRLFYRVLNLMKFGEHRGGMFVHATGLRNGLPIKRSWHLLAEGDDGPLIPSMAIEALIRKLLAGERPAHGARAAIRELELEDYEQSFAGRAIYTGFRDDDAIGPIYRRILGSAFDQLPLPMRQLHGSENERSWRGTANVRRGRRFASRLIRAALGFPGNGDNIPVKVSFSPDGNGERWTRNFNSHVFSSHQSCGTGKDDHLLIERFGVVSVSMALVVENARLFLRPRRWSVLGVPMPKFFLPNGLSFESEAGGKFRFDVNVSMPIIGLVAAYEGELTQEI